MKKKIISIKNQCNQQLLSKVSFRIFGVSILFLCVFYLQAQPKLSAATKLLLHKLTTSENQTFFDGFVYKQDENAKIFLSGFAKVEADFDEINFERLGVKTGTKAGNIYTLRVPLENFRKFTETPGIQSIDLDQPAMMLLDSARKTTKVDSVHGGYNLPMPYTGKNVVVGIIDAGFDYSHPVFYDTAYNNYRVKKVWEQKSSGTPPQAFSYGNELDNTAAILSKKTDITDGSHGTHVAGIAAGSGFGGDATNQLYRGVAFNSDLIFTAIYPTPQYWLTTGMSDMLDGIAYTFDYAESVNKPAVANLSWGCPLGPHDGNSLFSQACDNIVGPGKIFVLSGGNNNQNMIHLKKTFTATDTSVATIVTFPSSLSDKKNQIDIWGEENETFCIDISLWNGTIKSDYTSFICLDDNVYDFTLNGSDGNTCEVSISTVIQEFNNKPHVLVQISSNTNNKVALTVESKSGTVNMWQGVVVKTSGYYGTFAKSGYSWAVNGDAEMVVSDMVTTRKAISVAAYNSKNTYFNIDGAKQVYSAYTPGAIAPFSSKGPAADGRTKPDIAGPGMIVISAVSSEDSSFMPSGSDYSAVASVYHSSKNGTNYSFVGLGGTSMSSPAVSGIVALMLEVNPQLSPETILQVFKETAITDNHTGTIPLSGSNTWGFGKVNAYEAVKRALSRVGITHEPSELKCLLYPNPTNGNYQIQLLGKRNETADIRVLDAGMREIQTRSFNLNEGENNIPLSLDYVADGMYFVKIKTNDKEAVVRVVKQ